MKIVHYPHPALRFPAKPVAAIDKAVQLQAGRMLELMYEAKGLGLAAPQVALPIQLLVMNFAADPGQPDQQVVALNPVILSSKGSDEDKEGCLSFPDLFQKVRRAKTVTVRAYNLQGELFEATANGLAARVWQHEIDHLHGILFIDKMGPLGKLGSRGALKEFERVYRKAQERGDIPPDAEIERQLREYRSPPDPPGPEVPPPPPEPHPPVM
jgi:peptide deformylase